MKQESELRILFQNDPKCDVGDTEGFEPSRCTLMRSKMTLVCDGARQVLFTGSLKIISFFYFLRKISSTTISL